MVSSTTRLGPFELGPLQPQWGPAWHAARTASIDDDDLPARCLVRVPLPGEGPTFVLEGVRRTRLVSPYVPRLLRRGDDGGRAFMAFPSAVAVKLEHLIEGPPETAALPVPFALDLASSLAQALAALDAARHTAGVPTSPSFDELLVTNDGRLVVITPPPGTRMMQPGLLRISRRDHLLHAPEGIASGPLHTGGKREWGADVYAVGSALFQLLTSEDPRGASPGEIVHDIPRRVDDVVRRAMAKDPADRYESIDELVAALAAAAADFPPLEDEERASLVFARAPVHVAAAERSLT